MEEEIKIINDIIAISVGHGGDLGGPYYTMPKKLCKIINLFKRNRWKHRISSKRKP